MACRLAEVLRRSPPLGYDIGRGKHSILRGARQPQPSSFSKRNPKRFSEGRPRNIPDCAHHQICLVLQTRERLECFLATVVLQQ